MLPALLVCCLTVPWGAAVAHPYSMCDGTMDALTPAQIEAETDRACGAGSGKLLGEKYLLFSQGNFYEQAGFTTAQLCDHLIWGAIERPAGYGAQLSAAEARAIQTSADKFLILTSLVLPWVTNCIAEKYGLDPSQ